jgi:hypothetical protein
VAAAGEAVAVPATTTSTTTSRSSRSIYRQERPSFQAAFPVKCLGVVLEIKQGNAVQR